jgi:hypothetical protein
VGFFVSDVQKLTDPVKANQLRDKILSVIDQVKQELSQSKAVFSPDVASDLAMIQKGLPRDTGRDRSVPRVPEGAACVIGLPRQRPMLNVEDLDLAARLEQDAGSIASAREEFSRALANASSDGGRRFRDALVALVKAFNQAVMRIWGYQKAFRILPRDGPAFADQIGRYEERLTPSWFADRTMVELSQAGSLFEDWLAGHRELLGVFRLTSKPVVTLKGPLRGRAVLVIDADEVTLEDMPAVPGDLVTVVCGRGRVRVSGKVFALVIVSDKARFEMAPGAELSGGLTFSSES